MASIVKHRFLFVTLIALLLFPCVSFTDDLVLLQNLAFDFSTQDDSIAAAHTNNGFTPEPVTCVLLKELQHLQCSGTYSIAPELAVVSVVTTTFASEIVRHVALTGSRSPPTAL